VEQLAIETMTAAQRRAVFSPILRQASMGFSAGPSRGVEDKWPSGCAMARSQL